MVKLVYFKSDNVRLRYDLYHSQFLPNIQISKTLMPKSHQMSGLVNASVYADHLSKHQKSDPKYHQKLDQQMSNQQKFDNPPTNIIIIKPKSPSEKRSAKVW